MPDGLALVCAIAGCSADQGRLLIADATARGVDVLCYLATHLRHDQTEIYARAADWAGLAFAKTVPPAQRISGPRERIARLAETQSLRARLGGRSVIFVAPTFRQVLVLAERARTEPDARDQVCIVPPRQLRQALVERHRDGLIDFSRRNLVRIWPRGTARLGPGLRFGFVGILVVLLLIAVLAPFEARPVLVPILFVLLVLPSWFRIAAVLDRRDTPAPSRAALADDASLPVYSLLIPLRDEAHMVPQLVAVLSGLDYPALCINLKS